MSTNIFKQREKEYALERLRVLKGKYPEALEVLNFYEHILRYQREAYQSIKDKDWRKGIKWFYRLLDICMENGNEEISKRAEEFKGLEKAVVEKMIGDFIK